MHRTSGAVTKEAVRTGPPLVLRGVATVGVPRWQVGAGGGYLDRVRERNIQSSRRERIVYGVFGAAVPGDESGSAARYYPNGGHEVP